MTTRPVYVVPQPVLRQKAADVSTITPEIQARIGDMLDTMYAARGIGLAAPQIGVSQRIIVLDVEQPRGNDDDEDSDTPPVRGNPLALINPEIVWSSEEFSLYNEGCLSIPHQYAEIERPAKVRVRYIDPAGGDVREIEADGILATCLQHEIDHLNGILFIDYLSGLKRDMVLRKVRKWTKEIDEDTAALYVL